MTNGHRHSPHPSRFRLLTVEARALTQRWGSWGQEFRRQQKFLGHATTVALQLAQQFRRVSPMPKAVRPNIVLVR